MIGEGGESWERPISNNGPIKAERKKKGYNYSLAMDSILELDFCVTSWS